MSEKRILVLRQNLALRKCRTAVHFLLPLFQKIATSFFHKELPDCPHLLLPLFREIYNQFFYKRRRAGILPLIPYKPQKSRMDGLSGKNFSGGSVFPDNKAFRKLRFARCLKKWQPFQLQCLIRNFWKFAKNGRKKSSKSFSDLLLCVPLRGGDYSILK